MDKPKFATMLSDAIRAKNYTQEQVAAIVKMLPNSFRTKMARNTFTKREAHCLTEMLGLPMPDEDAIEKGARWDKELPTNANTEKTLAQVIRDVDRHRDVFEGHKERLADRLVHLVAAMRNGDLSVSASSTVTPLEFSHDADETIINAIAIALKNDATFVYLRPNEAYLNAFINVWRYDGVPGYEEIRREVDWFRVRIIANLTKSHQVSAERARLLAKKHIIQLYVSESPFYAAGFNMAMFHTIDLDGTTLRRMTIRLPGSRAAILQPDNYDKFAARFTSFTIQALRAVGKRDEDKEGRVSLSVTAHDEELQKPDSLQNIVDILEAGGAYV